MIMMTLGGRLAASLARCGGAKRGLRTVTVAAPAGRAAMLCGKRTVARPHHGLLGRNKQGRWSWQSIRLLVTHNRDPYCILGVSKDEQLDVIKATYLKLAKQHHPDSDGGDAEVFKELATAMREILLERRHLNDQGTKGAVADHDRPLHRDFDPGFIFDFVRDSLDAAKLKREVKDMTKDMETAGPDMGGWFFMAEMIAAGTETSGTGTGHGRGEQHGRRRIADKPPSLHARGAHHTKNSSPQQHSSSSSTSSASSASASDRTGNAKDPGAGNPTQ